MKDFYIQFGLLHAIGALCFLLSVVLLVWILGYAKGARAAERQFCDKFVPDATPPSTPA